MGGAGTGGHHAWDLSCGLKFEFCRVSTSQRSDVMVSIAVVRSIPGLLDTARYPHSYRRTEGRLGSCALP